MKITIPVRTKKILTFEENELLHIKVLIAGGEEKKKKSNTSPTQTPCKTTEIQLSFQPSVFLAPVNHTS